MDASTIKIAQVGIASLIQDGMPYPSLEEVIGAKVVTTSTEGYVTTPAIVLYLQTDDTYNASFGSENQMFSLINS